METNIIAIVYYDAMWLDTFKLKDFFASNWVILQEENKHLSSTDEYIEEVNPKSAKLKAVDYRVHERRSPARQPVNDHANMIFEEIAYIPRRWELNNIWKVPEGILAEAPLNQKNKKILNDARSEPERDALIETIFSLTDKKHRVFFKQVFENIELIETYRPDILTKMVEDDTLTNFDTREKVFIKFFGVSIPRTKIQNKEKLQDIATQLTNFKEHLNLEWILAEI